MRSDPECHKEFVSLQCEVSENLDGYRRQSCFHVDCRRVAWVEAENFYSFSIPLVPKLVYKSINPLVNTVLMSLVPKFERQ